MDVPGISLFQGGESIKLDTISGEEEEEELKDQKRRKEELDIMIQNAFDDLDDDETTIDSTTNNQADFGDEGLQKLPMQHHQITHPYTNVVTNGYHEEQKSIIDHSDCVKEIHNLKMLVESHRNELKHSQQLLEEEHKRNNELEKKLALMEAELERSLFSKQNNHELLVESKEKISNLQNTINKMLKDRQILEEEKNGLVGKLETSQTLLSDVQRKYDMVERDLNKNQERSFEVKRKQMEDRHRAEIAMLQQQMDQVGNKLDKKISELESLNSRYQALQQSHQIMLCDNASKMNDLNHALLESQKQCQELLSRPDYFQENIKLQKFIASLQEQIQSMDKTIHNLKERLEMTTAELDSMDMLLLQHNQNDSPRRLSQTQGRIVGSTPLNPLDKVSNLKEELHRALANIKSKREEIRKLEQFLNDKQAEIKHLKQDENKSLVQITTLKEENIKMRSKLKILEEEFDQVKSHRDTVSQQEDNRAQKLHKDLEDVKAQLECEKENALKLKRYNLQQESERKQLDAKLNNLEIDLEELKQEHESLKLNYELIFKENLCLKQRKTADNLGLELERQKFLLKDSQAECVRLKNLYIEISNGKEALSYEMDKLLKTDKAKELQDEKEKVANLQRSLKLAEVKCSELTKLLETEKLSQERAIAELCDKFEKEKSGITTFTKEATNECTKCMDYVAELTKFEIQNLKLSNTNSINKKEIDDLIKELKISKDHIAELNGQIKLSEEQEHVIKELKTKATLFEEYIKSHCTASEDSNISIKSSRQVSDKSVSTSPELERTEIKKIEARIRDEMAKIFAMELKRFQIKLQDAEEQIICLTREYKHINAELQQRQTEVNVLKQAILAERERMDEILKRKDYEYEDVIKKQNITILKTRDDLKINLQRIKELTNELKERQTQIESERKSMKAVMKQWEEQRNNLDAVEMEWNRKFRDLQKAQEIAVQSWQTKYNSAKRTAANYKRYSEDKEAHMLKEYDRLKLEYDAQLVKIQLRMKESLEKKSLELKQVLDNQRVSDNNNKENTACN